MEESYCSKEHQTESWMLHKTECKKHALPTVATLQKALNHNIVSQEGRPKLRALAIKLVEMKDKLKKGAPPSSAFLSLAFISCSFVAEMDKQLADNKSFLYYGYCFYLLTCSTEFLTSQIVIGKQNLKMDLIVIGIVMDYTVMLVQAMLGSSLPLSSFQKANFEIMMANDSRPTLALLSNYTLGVSLQFEPQEQETPQETGIIEATEFDRNVVAMISAVREECHLLAEPGKRILDGIEKIFQECDERLGLKLRELD